MARANLWSRDPDCCDAPELAPAEHLSPRSGPWPERVLRCARCEALWVEALCSRTAHDGGEDRDFTALTRIGAEAARARFGR